MRPVILAAFDFEAPSEAALAWVSRFAPTADLTLLHVVVLVPPELSLLALQPQYPSPEQLKQTHDALQVAASRFGLSPRIDVVVDADAAMAIVNRAEASACDLIVMGSHGRAGLARALLGSVADVVLRRASCPVLLMRDTPAQRRLIDAAARRESGLPGGGQGRADPVAPHGVFPWSTLANGVDPELRSPASITPNAPYDESGRSGPTPPDPASSSR